MEINRTQSRNSVLGINSIIPEEETADSCPTNDPSIDSEATVKLKPEIPLESLGKYDNMSNVKCVAIIEDVEKMFDMNDSQIVTRNLDNSTSIESSTAPSFTSVLNSLVRVSDLKTQYDASESTLVDGTGRKEGLQNKESSDAAIASHTRSDHALTDRGLYTEPKKEKTLSCALLLDESQIRYRDDLDKKKPPPPYEKLNVPQTAAYGAMPYCYVISKDDYFKTRMVSSLAYPEGWPKSGAPYPTFQINRDPNSPIVVSPNMTYTPVSNQTNTNLTTDNVESTCNVGRDTPKSSSRRVTGNVVNSGAPIIRGNSMVSVVNKGSSSMLILKIQTHVKNYMDINPDFGWRRLIDDKNLPFSNFSNNSYMFYIESKKSTHIISLANLAINIAVRAFILAITHGYFELSMAPRFLLRYLPQHISNALPQAGDSAAGPPTKPLNFPAAPAGNSSSSKQAANGAGHLPKHYYYKGGVDFMDDECGVGTMYLKSNFLGIFAISSLVRNLSSDHYRNRYNKNKKAPQHNVDLPAHSDAGSDATPPVRNDQQPQNNGNRKHRGASFYKYVPIPEYGWRLLAKAPFDNREDPKHRGIATLFSRMFKKKPRFDSLYPNSLLCKMRPPHHSDLNCKIMVDAGSLAMNVAEQLYRLEISTNNREKFPKNTFGFSATQDSKVVCPDGTVVDFVPEELILNTASLVHEIYITQTYLIL